MRNKKHVQGLTLLELLVVIAIIGIVFTFAVPNISKFATSRIAEKDLTTIRSLIDYAKTTSYSKGKTMVLFQTNNSVKVYELRSNDPTKCLGNVNDDKEYSKVKILKSNIKAKHNNNANITGSFNNLRSRMCFKSDNTSTGGGFEIQYKDDVYRIEIWATGFYNIKRKIKGNFTEYN